MKYNGEYAKDINIQQYEGGYVVRDTSSVGFKSKIVVSFEDLCDELAHRFGLKEIGERVVISATKEKKESNNGGFCE